MSRSRKSILFGLLLIPVMAGGFVFQQRETQQGARLLDQVLNIVSSRFVDTVDAATLYEKAARGLVHELNDPYSVLLSPKELSSFNAQTNGRYAGIGMEIAETQGFISVQRVFPHARGAGRAFRKVIASTSSIRRTPAAGPSRRLPRLSKGLQAARCWSSSHALVCPS